MSTPDTAQSAAHAEVREDGRLSCAAIDGDHLYREHVKAEGRNAWNDNPDGCYYCGSPHHHSSDCAECAL